MAFWNRNKSPDPEKYFQRSSKRMASFNNELERLELMLNRGDVNQRKMLESLGRLRSLLDEQRSEVTPPHQALQDHKQGYIRIMDLQVRKVEDFIHTGGANMERFLAEEEAISSEMEDRARAQHAEVQALADEYGFEAPDFSQPNRR